MNYISQMLTSLVLVFGVFYVVDTLEDLPSYLPRCRRTDPNLEQCLLNATEVARPYVKSGIPHFLGSAEHFTIPKIVMEQGNRAVNFKAEFNNITVMGLENYQFHRYQFDVPKSFYLEVVMPEVHLHGEYKLEGKIFFAIIKGEGEFGATIPKAANNVIRDNLDVIIEEITPTIEEVLSKMFDDYIFAAVIKVPYDKLYPE